MRHFQFYLILACLAASCGRHQTKPSEPVLITHITVFDDRTYPTDSITIRPDADVILSHLDCSHHIEQAAVVKFVVVTDKKLNPEIQCNLAGGLQADDDPHAREKTILYFYGEVRHLVAAMNGLYPPTTSFPQSQVYSCLSKEMCLLAGDKNASRRIIFAYTDLADNNAWLSCYDPRIKKEMFEHPERTAERLNKECPLSADLHQLELHIFYRPHTIAEDQNFQAILNVYQVLLSNRNATIYVHASNTFNLSN